MSGVAKKLMGTTAAGGGGFTAIEDVFSTYLITGTEATQTITNGIDLAGEGGLVWLKSRPSAIIADHYLADSTRTITNSLSTNTTAAATSGSGLTQTFNSDGFSAYLFNETYASWTFRKAPRFFDVVTWTGDAVSGREIAHSLGTTPGCIIIKRTNADGYWTVYHKDVGNTAALRLPLTNAPNTYAEYWSNTSPTSTHFTVGSWVDVNGVGDSFVAYLYAHDPLGPSGDGSDGLISCGSFTTDGSGNATVDLGWEPQWLLTKKTNSTGDWTILDSMRGFPTLGLDNNKLYPNTSGAEVGGSSFGGSPDASGFKWFNDLSSQTYIYIAIRRGPMRVPESGTEVFNISTRLSTSPRAFSGFPVDGLLRRNDINLTGDPYLAARITAGGISTNSTAAEFVQGTDFFANNEGVFNGTGTAETTDYYWMFRRAPNFFDVVAYTGNGADNRQISHNLGVAPELAIVKRRIPTSGDWEVWTSVGGLTQGMGYRMMLQTTNSWQDSGANFWGTTGPDFNENTFLLGTSSQVNFASGTYIAYLFATLAGVSKVFSVTKSSGSNADVNCGFTSGPRFVLLKRTDSTGDWYVWDTARGIIAGDDPYLLLNSTAAEVTSTDYIDPTGNGFTIVDGGLANGDYIGLAIA